MRDAVRWSGRRFSMAVSESFLASAAVEVVDIVGAEVAKAKQPGLASRVAVMQSWARLDGPVETWRK